ncbi:MAG: malto-oligosyltrehalose trehalohydrolase [Aquamicrobium sp.]|nr:malto-oligosyltrehalose trehalohydrolase [Aquamicrobium sp.]
MDEAQRDLRTFPKSWGAEFVRDGQARFRLWAPQVDRVTLRLAGKDADMGATEDGWFELMAEGVEPGQPYQFILADGLAVPDPASRAQAGDVHGPSLVIDPTAYGWRNAAWVGRPWQEAVIYELHVGTFTRRGTFVAAAERLEYLSRLGVTAVELMPVGQFAGTRGWGYDGVLPYAPHNAYGTPDDLKQLIDEAHGLGMMILLDVVYNHFGPDGNYLSSYAKDFFDPGRQTPWGNAIAYERGPVRNFFIENALYWLDEFNLDGLRLDAIDQIRDPSEPHLLVELAQRVRREFPERHLHLTTEDNRNITGLHVRSNQVSALYTAEWNDDFHNAAHVLLTGEVEGYYEDFARDPLGLLARCLAEGFAYQGEPSVHAHNKARGEPSRHLPTTAFINFLQNHDQIGNRALGERLSVLAPDQALEALTAVLLLSPQVPLMFMGEEWGETRPFNFFTDFSGELGDAVREGRRREFGGFAGFASQDKSDTVPDPNALTTFDESKIDWVKLQADEHRRLFQFSSHLLALRTEQVIPMLDDRAPTPAIIVAAKDGRLAIDWQLSAGLLQLRANLSGERQLMPPFEGKVIFDTHASEQGASQGPNRSFAPWRAVSAVRA